MTKQTIAILGLVSLVCVGCASYSHERTTADGTTEKTKARFFAGAAKAKNINGTTRDGTYERIVGVGEVVGESDTANQAAVLEAVARGVATGLKPTP